MVAGQGAVLSVIHTLQRSNKHDVMFSAPTFWKKKKKNFGKFLVTQWITVYF